jgi:hypothetical protein
MDSYLSSWENDPDFVALYREFDGLTNLNGDPNPIDTALYARLYILMQLAKQQSNTNKPFAEAGVYAGMSMFFTAPFCTTTFVGIDSFEGVSEPGEYDTEYFKKVKLSLDMSYAQNILKKYNNVSLYKGWIPTAFSNVPEHEYSLVNIDVDLYEPTKASIEYFWPRLACGGVLVCDDYGSSKTIGAKKAMNDFFGRNQILELPTGQALVYKHA